MTETRCCCGGASLIPFDHVNRNGRFMTTAVESAVFSGPFGKHQHTDLSVVGHT